MSDEKAVREAWDKLGAAYDEGLGASFTAIAEAALRFADIRAGLTLLDVAAGSGALSIPAARLGAEVLATDLSPGMLGLLQHRAEEARISGIRTAVMDGKALELDDGAFDRVCSQFGVMLFPEPEAGLREMVRVTAPGGLGVMVIFGEPERVVPVWLFGQALRSTLPDVELPAVGRLQTEPASLRDAMQGAGYADVRLETLDRGVAVGSASDAWDVLSSSAPGLAMFLRQLQDAQVAAVRDAFVASVVAGYGANVAELPVEVIVGIGRKR